MSNIIQFYLPVENHVFDTLPFDIQSYWQWQSTSVPIEPYWGCYHWILQTFLYLKNSSIDCVLTNQRPLSGILVTHVDFLDYGIRPSSNLFIIGLLVDRLIPNSFAQIHVTHNSLQQLPFYLASQYIPPWPQVNLIPRNTYRGEVFKKIGYFGYVENLDPLLNCSDFYNRLIELGLEFYIPNPRLWNDFSEVDAVLAVRSFGECNCHINKPALKLFNAWLAEVPAIVGYESASQSIGKPNVNYLQATSVEQVLDCLASLKNNIGLRNSLVSQGRLTVNDYKPDITIQRWEAFFNQIVFPAYLKWQKSPVRVFSNSIAGNIRERLLWRRSDWFS